MEISLAVATNAQSYPSHQRSAMNASYAVQDLDRLFVQVVVQNPSAYSIAVGGIDNCKKHIVELRNYRACGNTASETTLVFSISPNDGDGKIVGPLEKVSLGEIFQVLGNTVGRYEAVKFVNVHGKWDHRLNTLLYFLLFRTRELHLFDFRTQDHIPALHGLSFDPRCAIEKLLIYENDVVTKEKSTMLFHAIGQMQQLRFLQIDGKFPAEFKNQLCSDLTSRLRNMRNLEQFNLVNTAFDTLGNDCFFSELLFVVATMAQVRTIVAMSDQNTNKSSHTAHVVRRYLNFSSLLEMCCNPNAKSLRSLHFRYVHLTPNHREDPKQANQVKLLDLQHAFHMNQAGDHNTRGDQSLLDFTQAQVLRLFPNLCILRLNHCRVQTTDHLSWYLEKPDSQLVELLLEHNQIGRDEFLKFTEVFPGNKTLRVLSLHGNPFEHNLTLDDKAKYHSSLLSSSLINFPFKGGIDREKWLGAYKRLTPYLCLNQVGIILDTVRIPTTKQVPATLWSHLLKRIDSMGTFATEPSISWPTDIPYESSQQYFKSMAFFASSEKSVHTDCFNAIFSLLTKEMSLLQAIGTAISATEPALAPPAMQRRTNPLDGVLEVVDLHTASKSEDSKEQILLDDVINDEIFQEEIQY